MRLLIVEDEKKVARARRDDYLVKPFAFSELLARIRAVLRRGRPDQVLKRSCGMERRRAWAPQRR